MGSVNDLENFRKELASNLKNTEKNKVIIKIAMSTCSIATGSKNILDYFNEAMLKQSSSYRIITTGCTGLCHSEPTVEVKLPGSEPVMFGPVDVKTAEAIINEYIVNGKSVDCVIGRN